MAHDFDVGDYAAAATVYLPAEARLIRSRAASLVELIEREFDRRVLFTVLSVAAGETTTAEVLYSMPAPFGVFDLGVVPQAELRPTSIDVHLDFPDAWIVTGTPPADGDGSSISWQGTPITPCISWQGPSVEPAGSGRGTPPVP